MLIFDKADVKEAGVCRNCMSRLVGPIFYKIMNTELKELEVLVVPAGIYSFKILEEMLSCQMAFWSRTDHKSPDQSDPAS